MVIAVVVVLGLSFASDASAFVYWAGYAGSDSIGRANLDGTNVDTTFIPFASDPCGVAVDGENIYWAASLSGSILRAKLDGSIPNGNGIGGASDPCGVAVTADHIYWTNGGGGVPAGTTIGRANLDGTGVDQSFISGASGPCAVAADASHLYWTNCGPTLSGGTTIGRANLDGSGVDESFITGLSDVCGIAVDGQHIYWTTNPAPANSFDAATVGRANLDGSGIDQSFIVAAPARNPGFAVCGLAVDGSHVYWDILDTTTETSTIGRASLDGSGVDRSFIATGRGALRGVAVDSLYPSTTTLTASPASTVYGEAVTLTATVASADPADSPATPAGSVQFQVNGTDVGDPVAVDSQGKAEFTPADPLDVGDTVTANYGGGANYTASSDDLTPDIAPAETATSLSASPTQASFGDDVTLVASVENLDTTVIPFGTVHFLIDGFDVFHEPLDDKGQAGIVVSDLDAGDHVVEATYEDDTASIPDFGSSDSAAAHVTITKASQTITFGALPDKTYGNADFAVSATASSSLTVSFAASGQCTVSGANVHITGAGSCTITASQPGNANYNAAPDVARSFSIAKAGQTIAFAPLPGKTFGDPDFTISAGASPSNLPVTFAVTGSCAISGTTVHITGAGSCTLTASQAGDADYNAAADVAQTVAVAKAGQTISFAPLASRTYGSADFAVSATASSGLPVSFAASGTCTIGGATMHLTGAGPCMITASQPGDANYDPAASVSQSVSIVCRVPDVIGKKLSAAETAIARRGCRTGSIRRTYSSKIGNGRVDSQSRRAGRLVPARTNIDLVVSRGRRH